MKKLLLSSMACLAFAGYANAQAPAEWQVGQNVAKEIGMGDLDTFSGAMTQNGNGDYDVTSSGEYWKGDVPNEYSNAAGPSIISYYNKGIVNIYQVVKFPAGSYTIDVQALYREGTPLDNFQNHFNKKQFKNGHLYAEAVDINGTDTTVTRTFDKVLCSLATADQHERLFFDADGSWKNDYEYKRNEKEEGAEEDNWVSYFCPQCLPGLGEYFLKDKYHNTMKVVLTEDTWVRIGLRKTGFIAQDWMPFTNFQVIYNGPADDAAKMELGKEEVTAVLDELASLQNTLDAGGFQALAAAISDIIMESEDTRDSATSPTELTDLLASLKATAESYTRSVEFVNSLNDLINMSTDMLASTEFEGKAAFQTAYDDAVKKAATDDIDALGSDPAAFYQKVYNELAKARADYLNTAPANEKGAKDFTSLIKHPWFVNPEYNPSLNGDGRWVLTEPTWTSWENPGDYSKYVAGRTDICSKVQISSDVNVTNQWFKYVNYTSGWSPGIRLYKQALLVGASTDWNSGLVGSEEVRQQLVGLPNGYYSLNALIIGWDSNGTWNTNPKMLGCFAENSEEVRVASITSENINNFWNWSPEAWEDVQTGIILINDGKLLIGAGTSIAGSFTGFRLSFYGESPDFNQMITNKVDYINQQMEASITFKGDQAAIKEILSQVVQPITTPDAYEAALLPLKQAQDYINAATPKMKDYASASETITALAEREYVGKAFEYILGLGEGETDTYELVDAAVATVNAYKQYCDTYDKVTAIEDNVIADIVKEQTESMKAELKTAEQLQAYMDALSLPYNIALLAAAGAADATEANPANVTSLIVNPSFTDSPTDGWSGETPTINEYGRGNAELWNKSAFTLSQKIAGLPAGTYELRAKAIYRDGGSVTPELVEAYNTAGSLEAWENHNAQLFAKVSDENDQFVYIKAIESLKGTGNSFTYVATAFDSEEAGDGSTITFATKFQKITGTEIPAEEIYGEPAVEEIDEGKYPFDTKLAIGEETLYYPSSMQGFYQWCVKSPEAVANSVRITVENGDVLEIGIRKTAAISSDWVIFDDFELYYLTGETFKEVNTSVESIDAATKSSNSYLYNVAGQKVDKTYKGFVITKGKKVVKQ